MTSPFALACYWVLAATATALLPMRIQMVPGLALLLAAPVLLWAIATAYGPWVFLAILLAVLSVFRRPLSYLIRRLLRLPVALEDDR